MATVSLNNLKGFADKIIKGNIPPRRPAAAVLCLTGDLGAGKTSFTQELAKILGVKEPVRSPTFVIEKIYALDKATTFNYLVHIDCYRLDGGESLPSIGWDDVVRDPGNIIVVEWADKIKDFIPESAVWISFSLTARENEREIEVVK